MPRRIPALLLLALAACTPAAPPPAPPAAPPPAAPPVASATPSAAPTAAPTRAAPAAPPSPHDGTIAGLERMHAAMPQEGAVLYLLAYFNAEAGRRDAVYRWLDELARLAWDLGIDDGDFKAIAAEPRYQEIARALNPRVPTVAGAPVAFRLAERDLIPEGIAHDPKRKEFFVSSIHKRKIVRVRADGKVSDFIAPATGGIGGVLGMRVDPKRDALWAAANPGEGSEPAEPAAPRAIYQFALKDGKLVASYPAPEDGKPHLLNDVAIGGDGAVYVTDSEGGGVFRLKPGAAALDALVPAGSMVYPNGIVADAGGRALYVADAVGLWSVDLQSGERRRLQAPAGTTLGCIDGLSQDGADLVAVQNLGKTRLIRVTVDAAAGRVSAVKVLASQHPEFELPTTAALAGGDAYVIANSQLRAKDESGKKYLPADRLKETVILRVRAR